MAYNTIVALSHASAAKQQAYYLATRAERR